MICPDTAVTRAKRLLVMVGSSSLVAAMVDNEKRTLRYTALRPFLEEAMPQKLTDAPTIWEEIGPGGAERYRRPAPRSVRLREGKPI